MISENTICAVTLCVVVPLSILVLRLIVVLPAVRFNIKEKEFRSSTIPCGSKLMILLGSGGHTGEMLRLLEKCEIAQCSRTWLVSSGDTVSLLKAKRFEDSVSSEDSAKVKFAELYRARRVGEPLISSIISTIKSILSTAQQLSSLPKPDVLLVNGPGTSVPVAYVLFIMRYLGLCRTRIVYVESLARVNSLSLSGRLILPISDRFLVQWKPLSSQYKRAEFYGILI